MSLIDVCNQAALDEFERALMLALQVRHRPSQVLTYTAPPVAMHYVVAALRADPTRRLGRLWRPVRGLDVAEDSALRGVLHGPVAFDLLVAADDVDGSREYFRWRSREDAAATAQWLDLVG